MIYCCILTERSHREVAGCAVLGDRQKWEGGREEQGVEVKATELI